MFASLAVANAHDGALRQLDLEVVVFPCDRSRQCDLGCVAKRVVSRLAARQDLLGFDRAPWLGRDAAQPQPRPRIVSPSRSRTTAADASANS